MNKKILVVDDDFELSMIIKDMLEDYGYNVAYARDSEQAYKILVNEKFSLIILDINLPTDSGFEVCKQLRRVSMVPIIFASARTKEDDRIEGLDIGGDDYLSKPYSLKELLSRVNALMRRTYGFTEKVYKYGNIEINLNSRVVKKNNEVISLSLKEFDLLAYLVEHKNNAIKKETLLNEVWGAFTEIEISTVAVHIRWLREKLEDNPAKPTFLKTVWGVGYSWSEE